MCAISSSTARCVAGVFVLGLLVACGADQVHQEPDSGTDAATSDTVAYDADAASDTADDAASDSADDADATDAAGDAEVDTDRDTSCEACVYNYCPEYSLCESKAALELGVPLTDQDTADGGGMGDCATSASGPGGPNLYYSVTLPAGEWVRFVAAPTDTSEDAVMRILDDCYVGEAERSARGGSLTDGRATLCIQNDGSNDREVVVAVGRYSGEADSLDLEFDLSAELHDPSSGAGCF